MLQEASRAVDPSPSPQTHRVLAVDDNHDAADSLAWLLETLGAEVRVAYDGREALQLIRDWHPELVLLDVGMPGMDGLEVAAQVRANRDFDDVMLIALTGAGLDDDRERARNAGFDRHLLKPVDPDRLSEVLEQARGAH